DADVAGESGGDNVRRLRQVGDRFAVGRTAGTVDRVNGARLETEFFGGFGQRRAGRALVLEFVAQVTDLGLGAVLGDLAFDLGRHLVISFLRTRLDLADVHEHGAEAALDRGAGFAGLEREGGIGDG